MKQTLTQKIKLKLNYNQKIKINTLSNEHRLLYNHLLEFCKNSWYSGNGADFKGINEQYKKFKKENELTINSKSAQNTSRILINNIKSFYQSRKNKINNTKFPKKFKSYKIFTPFILDYNNGNGGFKFKNNILSLLLKGKSFLDIKINNFKDIKEKQITTIQFLKEKSNYYVSITYNANTNKKQDNGNYLSIDLGTSSIVTCYSNKINNLQIENTKFINLEKQISFLQNKLNKKKKYTKRYNRIKEILNKKYKKLTNKNKDFQHKVSKKIIDICKENEINTIICGDIKTKKLIIKSANKLNKNNQGRGTLSRFKNYLNYKSSISGINFHLVDESYTSQFNCITGKKEFSSNLDIREDEVLPGIIIDRDLNGAVNIFKKWKNEFKVKWLNHLQELNTLDKMYMDFNSNLYMKKFYKLL